MTDPTTDPTRARVAPDQGLPMEFLTLVAERLNSEGIRAAVEFPGYLSFMAHDRYWATGQTGLHVNDNDGFGISLPGDELLVELERGMEHADGNWYMEITLDKYVDVLLYVIRDRRLNEEEREMLRENMVLKGDRFKDVLERAQNAFWAVVAESYPEVKTGDFGPEETYAWETASENAVTIWLRWNYPGLGGPEVQS